MSALIRGRLVRSGWVGNRDYMAAISIQKSVRAMLFRLRKVRRQEQTTMVNLQAVARGKLARLLVARWVAASAKIQRAFRRYILSNRVYEKHEKSISFGENIDQFTGQIGQIDHRSSQFGLEPCITPEHKSTKSINDAVRSKFRMQEYKLTRSALLRIHSGKEKARKLAINESKYFRFKYDPPKFSTGAVHVRRHFPSKPKKKRPVNPRRKKSSGNSDKTRRQSRRQLLDTTPKSDIYPISDPQRRSHRKEFLSDRSYRYRFHASYKAEKWDQMNSWPKQHFRHTGDLD